MVSGSPNISKALDTLTSEQAQDHPHFVTKCKFVCLMHSEAKEMEMSEFGAEKGYCRTKQEERVAHAQKH